MLKGCWLGSSGLLCVVLCNAVLSCVGVYGVERVVVCFRLNWYDFDTHISPAAVDSPRQYPFSASVENIR